MTLKEAESIHPFLAKDWDQSTIDNGVIYAYARGDTTKPKGLEWESHQTFGFADVEIEPGQYERKYVARLWFTAPTMEQGVEKRLVYDFAKQGI